MGLLHFRVTTITNHRMPRGRVIPVLSLAVWWAKLQKNDIVRHNMTQIASLLAAATVFIGLWTLFYRGGGGLKYETKLRMQEHELKMQMQRGDLCARGCVIMRFYGTCCMHATYINACFNLNKQDDFTKLHYERSHFQMNQFM